MAVANRGAPSTPGSVSILLGNGDGTFREARNFAAGWNVNSVIAGDFNRDGIQDLVVTNSSDSEHPNAITILVGNGDGTFQPPRDLRWPSEPRSLAVGDFDGDGRQDLAVVAGYSIAILLGNGDATFRNAVHFGAGNAPIFVAAGDLNGDGAPDLAVAVRASIVSVLINNSR